MGNIVEQLLFSASITGPICLMLALGVILKRTQIINENFIDVASKLVFNVTLPALLFLSIISSNHDLASSAPLIGYGLAANFLFYTLHLCNWAAISQAQRPRRDHSRGIQGQYRDYRLSLCFQRLRQFWCCFSCGLCRLDDAALQYSSGYLPKP